MICLIALVSLDATSKAMIKLGTDVIQCTMARMLSFVFNFGLFYGNCYVVDILCIFIMITFVSLYETNRRILCCNFVVVKIATSSLVC